LLNAVLKCVILEAHIKAHIIFVDFCALQGAAALVLWYGGYLVYHSELTAGALTSLMLYTLNLAMAFGFLSSLYGDFMKVLNFV